MEETKAHERVDEVRARAFPPCADVSLQAREFMGQSSGAEWIAADFSSSGVAQLRNDNSAVGRSAWELVKTTCSVIVEDKFVGGVSCQWVSPLTVKGPEIVLFLFGGAFVIGSPEDDLSMTARLAYSMCRCVCVPRYRLAPEHPFPAALDDVLAVYDALAKHERVFVVGESAGGNLALGLTLKVVSFGDVVHPIAVGLLSPWIDLTHSGDSHLTLFGLDPTLSVKHFLEPASLAYAGQRSLLSPDISPLFAEVPTNFPRTIISSATRDLLLSDSVRLARKLRQKSCQVDLRIAEGLWHVYEWYPQCPEAVESLEQIATFLLCNV